MASTPRPSGRQVEGDRLRVAAMLGVFLTHALYAYAPSQPGWPTDKAAATTIVDFLVYAIHVLPMPVFFSLAGRYSAISVRRRGPRAFLTRRALRLLVPFAVGMVTIVPATYFLLVYGSVISEGAPHGVAWDVAVSYFQDGHYLSSVRVAHLWFFVYLLILSLIAPVVAHVLRGRINVPAGNRHLGALLLLLLVFALLFAMPGQVVEEPSGIVPNLPLLTLFGVFFAHGWITAGFYPGYSGRGRAWRLLLSTVVMLVLSYAIIYEDLAGGSGVLGRATHAIAIVSAFYAALAVAPLAGTTTTRLVRTLSDASLVVYVVHLPLVLLAQVVLMQSSVPAVLRIPATVLFGLAASLLIWWSAKRLVGMLPSRRPAHA